jgi:hypothetical protein
MFQALGKICELTQLPLEGLDPNQETAFFEFCGEACTFYDTGSQGATLLLF